MGQKAAGAGRRSAILQPAILKPDRLLGCRADFAAFAAVMGKQASAADLPGTGSEADQGE